MALDPRNLAALAAVVETGSVTRAAERLACVQSNITQRCCDGRVGGARRGRPRTKESRNRHCHDQGNHDEESWRAESTGESRAADRMIYQGARGNGDTHQVRWWS